MRKIRHMKMHNNLVSAGVAMAALLAGMAVAHAGQPDRIVKPINMTPAMQAKSPATDVKPIQAQTTSQQPKPAEIQETIPAMPGAMSVGQIDKYQSDITKLTYEAQKMSLKAKIAQAEEQIKRAKKGNVAPVSLNPNGYPEFNQPPGVIPVPANNNSQQTKTASFTYPTVRSVFGVNGKTQATMILPNGDAVRASPGDTLPDGVHIDSITSSGNVYVTKNGHKILLSFGAPPVTTSSSRASSLGVSPVDEIPNIPAGPPAKPNQSGSNTNPVH